MQVALREVGNCVIRRCDPSDIIPVMEINLKTLPEHYSDYFYESLLAELPEAFLVAEVEKRLVGYIMLYLLQFYQIIDKKGSEEH